MESDVSPALNPSPNPSHGERADTVSRVAQRAHEAIDRVAAKAGPAVEKARAAADGAVDTLNARADALSDLQDEWLETCRGYIRENPLAAVGVGVLAGLLLARLTSR